MRRASPWFLAVLVVGMLGSKLDRLDAAEKDHYFALKPFMEEPTQKAFLKLKTREERDQFLKELGLWDRFYKYDEDKRALIVSGDVKTGWTDDMVYMAWGQPYSRKRLTGRPAARSEMLVYRFETTPDGATMVWEEGSKATYKAVSKFQLDVYVDDNVITEIQRKDDWE